MTIDRPDRASRDGELGYTDRTYHATPASEQRVLRLMDERTWPTRMPIPKGWQVASTR
ncbi:MAG TPA: hypothetical protein VHP83_13310 [Aggregatilineaceae bacterium]|nr:hypothetical protein [Aggregatilineaceae bacterium]